MEPATRRQLLPNVMTTRQRWSGFCRSEGLEGKTRPQRLHLGKQEVRPGEKQR